VSTSSGSYKKKIVIKFELIKYSGNVYVVFEFVEGFLDGTVGTQKFCGFTNFEALISIL
jgi:hypothetical protein